LGKISQLSGYQLLIVGVIGFVPPLSQLPFSNSSGGSNQLTVVPLVSPLVSVLAQKYGKRMQFLVAALSGTLGTIICIVASQKMSYSALLAGRMIQGLGSTAWESLSLAAMGDIFHLHERGFRTALTVATLVCSTAIVSVIAGVLAEYHGWKTLFIAILPFQVVGLLGAIFLLPETQFRRSVISAGASADGATPRPTKSAIDEVSIAYVDTAPVSKPKMTYWESLMPWSGTYSDKPILYLLGEIFVQLINPAVVWILLVSGVVISLYVGTAYILAQIWTAPPYNLTVVQNGYFFTGSFIGGVLAIVAGPICDWTAQVLSRLNKGVFESEFRIPANIFGLLFSAVGWFLFMWVVDNPRPGGYYFGALFHGIACIGCSFPSTVASLYIL